MNYVIVFIGGGLGSVARYAVGQLFKIKDAAAFPYATLTVNMASSFILGLLASLLIQRTSSSNLWLLAAIGFCGGFSTFSAFTLELFNYLKNGMYGMAMLNIGVSVGGCLLALWIGFMIGKN
ncbi:MAG: fluoride efflux transporter CrcB [Bacteroidota bacterium]